MDVFAGMLPTLPMQLPCDFFLTHAQFWVYHFQITRGYFWSHLNYDLANLIELTTQWAVLDELSHDVSRSGAPSLPGFTSIPKVVIPKTYNSPLQMAWPCCRTMGVCIVILPHVP